MKRLLLIILSICLIPIMGCQSRILIDNPAEMQTLIPDITWQEMTEAQQTVEPEKTISANEERSDTEVPTQTVSQETTPPPTETKESEVPKPTVPKTEEVVPPPVTAPVPTEAETVPPIETVEPTESEEPKATATDSSVIAAKLVEYLNEYRTEQGSSHTTVLPGLTQYAEYRSRQLVTNFAHDSFDERVAATALEYGSYIDPAAYGMTGEPYYAANAREAIAKTDFGGSINAVAARLARMVRNSSSHWSYVGSSGYSYIGVGITYNNGVWYCDIAVADSNTDTQ